MSTAELIDRIRALSPEELAVVKAHINSAIVAPPDAGTRPKEDPLLDRITARRERILKRNGPLPDNATAIREWRDGIE
ncbi:MAG: hypothetical protein JJE39_04945 [Vicinamibacteria bacterium]|nr:hypothetical protein [Vicinamibacteria bacterium]